MVIAEEGDALQPQRQSSSKPFDQGLQLGRIPAKPVPNQRFPNFEDQIITGIAYRYSDPSQYQFLIPDLFLAHQTLEIEPEHALLALHTRRRRRRSFVKGFGEVGAGLLPLVVRNLHDLPGDLLVVKPTDEILCGPPRFDLALHTVFQFLLQSNEFFRLERDDGWGGGDGSDGVVSGGLGGGGGLESEGGGEGFLELEVEGEFGIGLEGFGCHEVAAMIGECDGNVVVWFWSSLSGTF